MPKYRKRLIEQPDIKSGRIAKNHAQMMALAEGLKSIIGMSDEQFAAVIEELRTMAVARQQAIGADHPVVANFLGYLRLFEYGYTKR